MTIQTIRDEANLREIPMISRLSYELKAMTLDMARIFYSEDFKLGLGLWIILGLFQTKLLIFALIGNATSRLFSGFYSADSQLKHSGLIGLNGIFIGLASATFYQEWTTALIIAVCSGILCSIMTVTLNRAIKVLGVPLLVLPYCITFYAILLVAREIPSLESAPVAASLIYKYPPLLSPIVGAVKAFGQILFVENVEVSLAVAGLLLWRLPHLFPFILLSSLVPELVVWKLFGHHWISGTGLASFGGILLYIAQRSGLVSLTAVQSCVLIFISGCLEIFAIKLLSILNLPALSISYIVLVWIAYWSCDTMRALPQDHGSAPW